MLIKDWYEISTDNHSKPVSRSNIKDEFDEGAKYTNTVYTYVGADGKLALTIAVPSFSGGSEYPNWICFNNVKLTYYYNAEDLTAYEGMLATAVAAANAVTPLPTQAAADLQAVVNTNNKTFTTSTDYQAAIDAIEAATTQAQAVKAAYVAYQAMKNDAAKIPSQSVFTDNNGAASTFSSAESAVEAAVQTASLDEAATTITTQKGVLWSAVLTFMKNVTINEGAGFNLTWMIKDADFSDTNYKNYWTETLASSTTIGVTNGVMRYYNSSFNLSQTLPYTLPAGAYRMKVDGFERTNDPMDTAWKEYADGNSIVTGTLYLNDNELLIMNLFDVQSVTNGNLGGVQQSGASFYVANGSSSANKYLAAGYYPNTLIGVLADDAAVTIGYRCANTKAWTCIDNFQLEYIGEMPQVAVTVTANELTPVCVPFTLNVSDEGVEELYAVGGVYDNNAKLYAVSTVEAGTPCVAKFSTNSYSAPMEKTFSNGRKHVLPWDGGLLVSDNDNLTWSYNGKTPASTLTFDVLDYSNLQFEVNLENYAARTYLANVTYAGSTDESKVAAYNVAPPTRRDIPNAVLIPVPAFEGTAATLTVQDNGETVATVTVAQGETQAYVYNLLPQKTYTFTTVPDGDASVTLCQGTFTTTGHLRMVYAPSAYNIRDFGGWMTQDGRHTNYGHLFRGSALNGFVNCTAEDLQQLRDLGVGAEIDLRWKDDYDKDLGCGTSAFGFTQGEDYYWAAANDYTAANLNESATQRRLKQEFDFILSHFRQGKAVYFHCAWGADRTGMLAFLLEGVLGLTLDQIYKDYELTSFSAAPNATNRLKSAFQDRIDVIQNLNGTTLRDKFENYFVNKLGIPMDDITYFRSVMLDNRLIIGNDATDNSTAIAALNGVSGINVTLQGRMLYKDGEWNTICLPFDIVIEDSPLKDAIAKTLDEATMTDTHVTLKFGDDVNVLKADKPYIIRWIAKEGEEDIVNPVFTGVTIDKTDNHISLANGNVQFIGYYDAFPINTPDDDAIYYMTAGNTLKHTGQARTLKACRAYFLFSDAVTARECVLNFGDDVITSVTTTLSPTGDSSVYDLQGRRVADASLKKGLYIRNGRKVVMK